MKKCLIIVFFAFLACSKKEVTPLSPKPGDSFPGATCAVKSITTASVTSTYSYNSSGLVDTIVVKFQSLTSVTVITYDAQGQLMELINDFHHVTFQIGTNGKPLSETIHDQDAGGSDFSEVISYTYDASGNLQKAALDANTYSRYEYNAQGNVSKIFTRAGSTETLSFEYTSYDDKKNPLTNVPFQVSVIEGGSSGPRIAVDYYPHLMTNNFLSVNFSGSTHTATYTYNSANYPLTGGGATYAYYCK
jgi:YD repeat-containing protein